jgi:hypothetical protein
VEIQVDGVMGLLASVTEFKSERQTFNEVMGVFGEIVLSVWERGEMGKGCRCI